MKREMIRELQKGTKVEHDEQEYRKTIDQHRREDNAPMPIPSPLSAIAGSKRAHGDNADGNNVSPIKAAKIESLGASDKSTESPEKKTGREIRSCMYGTGVQDARLQMGTSVQMSYSLMKDGALRKKLAELRIPNTGPRNISMRGHAEWADEMQIRRSPRRNVACYAG
ncbi:MAG: hypothetical protein Q9220_002181 [cf. Caloplaca sp. 1 TL-2023]